MEGKSLQEKFSCRLIQVYLETWGRLGSWLVSEGEERRVGPPPANTWRENAKKEGQSGHWLPLRGTHKPGSQEGAAGEWSCPGQCGLPTPSKPSLSPAGVSSTPALSEVFALDGCISQPRKVWNSKQNEQNVRSMLLRATERSRIWSPSILALAPAAQWLPPTDGDKWRQDAARPRSRSSNRG